MCLVVWELKWYSPQAVSKFSFLGKQILKVGSKKKSRNRYAINVLFMNLMASFLVLLCWDQCLQSTWTDLKMTTNSTIKQNIRITGHCCSSQWAVSKPKAHEMAGLMLLAEGNDQARWQHLSHSWGNIWTVKLTGKKRREYFKILLLQEW